MKPAKNKLLEAIQKIIEEALEEAGPLGYLSKTARPDAKTGWDPEAQKKWTQDKEATMGIASKVSPVTGGSSATSKPQPTNNPSAPPPQAGEQPPAEPNQDKTNISPLRSRSFSAKPAPQTSGQQVSSGEQESPLSNVSSMLQGASEEQLSQILRILKGN